MVSLELALLKIIGHNDISTAEIYKAIEGGQFYSLTLEQLRETKYGGRPAYQHEVRSYLSNLVQSGDIQRISRGNYRITQKGRSRLLQ